MAAAEVSDVTAFASVEHSTGNGDEEEDEDDASDAEMGDEFLEELNSVIDFWSKLDLKDKIAKLDDLCMSIGSNKDSAAAQRKQLIADIKQFNTETKGQMEVSREKVIAAMQLTQTGLTALSKRAKFAEDSFLEVYNMFAKAPDPAPLLGRCVDFAQRHESRTGEATQELEELQRDLESSRRLAEERGSACERHKKQVETLKHQLHTFRGVDQQVDTLKQQNNHLTELVNGLQASTSTLETDNGLLLQELKTLRDAQRSADQWMTEVDHREKTITDLVADIELHEARFSTLNREVAKLKAELDRRPTVEQFDRCKYAVQALKESGIACDALADHEDDDRSRQSFTVATASEISEPLEVSLARRNTQLQSSNEALTSEISILREDLQRTKYGDASVKAQLDKLKQTNTRLERELSEGHSLGAIHHKYDQDEILGRYDLKSIVMNSDEANNVLDSLPQSSSGVSPMSSGSSPFPAPKTSKTSPSSSFPSSNRNDSCGSDKLDPKVVIKALVIQRDRYRHKLETMDVSKQRMEQENVRLRELKEKLELDNTDLYGKTRFLTSELQIMRNKSKSPMSSSSSTVLNISPEIDGKYSKLYEESISPYGAWKAQQTEKRFKALHPAERVTFSATSFFLAYRWSRIFLLAYTAFLHLMIFASLWRRLHGAGACPIVN